MPEIILENGGVPVRTRVGHSFIKARMAETGAVFGGEHSGHFYFRDFWRADSGMLAALHTIAALGGTPEGTTLSALLAPYERYVASGEINSVVADGAAATAAGPRGVRGRARRDLRRPRRDDRHRPGLVVQRAARATPSRCCASTPRRPTRPRWTSCAIGCSALIRDEEGQA